MLEPRQQTASRAHPASPGGAASAAAAGPSVISLGCRLNAYEAEVMATHARQAGLTDAIIINTCAVTAEAVRQAGQTIRKTRRDNPSARIIVTGCAAQLEPERFAQMTEVDHVLGNDAKLRSETFTTLATPGGPRSIVGDIMAVRETAHHLIEGFGSRARAYVQIQTGCDHRCTFCIIPFARGASRSVPAGVVVDQIQKLVARGFAEVVLTGVDITSYGSDLPGRPALGRLTQQVLKRVPDLKRLRLSSIDQVEADATLLETIAHEPRLMPHLHLSLQAGADLILKRMRRRHGRKDAIDFCASVRAARPDIVFGADFIAGFPTETDAHFDETLDLVEACGLTYLHVFPYSQRPGTPAARMPQVPHALIKERAGRLRALGEQRHALALAEQVGATRDILLESETKGRTTQFLEAKVEGMPPRAVGSIIAARVRAQDGRRLICEALP